MHVLGLPPAFVLSQDQTLKLEVDPTVLRRKIRSRRNFNINVSRSSAEAEPRSTGYVYRKTSDSRSFCLKSHFPAQTRKSARWVRPARTPPSTFLFLKLQCQRAGTSKLSLKEKPRSWFRPRQGCPCCGGRFRPQTRCPVNRTFEVFFNFFAVAENSTNKPKRTLQPLPDPKAKRKAARPTHSNSEPQKCRPDCP